MHRYLAVVAFTLGCVWLSFMIPMLAYRHVYIIMLVAFGTSVAAFILERKRVGKLGIGAGAFLLNCILLLMSVPAMWYLASIYAPHPVGFISVGFIVLLWAVSIGVAVALVSRRD